MTKSKDANATRVGPDLYDVTFLGDDSTRVVTGVPLAHLQELAEQGYRVEVDQSAHRGPAEPERYVMALRGPLAPGTVITDGGNSGETMGPTELA